MGKASLQRATGLTKQQRVERAKKRLENDRRAEARMATAMVRNILQSAVASRAVEVKNDPAMLMEIPSGDTVVPPTPQNPEKKEEKKP